MKKTILTFLSIFFLAGCSKDDSKNTVLIGGRVENKVTGLGIPNQIVFLEILQKHGVTAYGSYNTKIDSRYVETDLNGNFSVTMKNDVNTFISAERISVPNDLYTYDKIITSNFSNNIKLKVCKYLKYKIYLKSINPFDINDHIEVYFFSGNYTNILKNIENFGVQNIHHPAQYPYGEWDEPIWDGANVNAILYYDVQEDFTDHILSWTKKKNGTQTIGTTPVVPLQINQEYEFYFNY